MGVNKKVADTPKPSPRLESFAGIAAEYTVLTFLPTWAIWLLMQHVGFTPTWSWILIPLGTMVVMAFRTRRVAGKTANYRDGSGHTHPRAIRRPSANRPLTEPSDLAAGAKPCRKGASHSL
jgi:hypothetical protein